MTTARPAVFIDRDGTLIVDRHYIGHPEDVELLPGAAEAMARLNAAGIPVIVISNQSGIGRGIFDEASYERVRARFEQLLAAAGARVDATYICPHRPEDRCECRKPGVKLYRQAAAEHGLDLARSWYIGDRFRDIAVARTLGGRGVLVPTSETPPADLVQAADVAKVSTSLQAAVDRVLATAH